MTAVAVVLVLLGVATLALFAAFVWPPLCLLPLGVAALAAGLFVDWEAVRGKSSAPPKR